MLIRELTNNNRLDEFGPFSFTIFDQLFGASPAGEYSDISDGAADIIKSLIANGETAENAKRIGYEFHEKYGFGYQNNAEAVGILKKLTGDNVGIAKTNGNDVGKTPQQSGSDAGEFDTPSGTSTTTKGNTVGMPSATVPNPKIGYGKGKIDPGLAAAAKVPNRVKNPVAAAELIQANPKDPSTLAKGISAVTNNTLAPTDISKYIQTASKYALPAAGIVALLYGGKKLYDYATRKKQQESMKETATAGATSSGNIASVANPKQAYGNRKRDKNGVPKAPQKKNPDGTAKNALDINNNLMGGKVAKR